MNAMVMPITREPWSKTAARINEKLKDLAAGPLLVAAELVEIAERWDSLSPSETGGMRVSAAYEHAFGYRLGFFQRRHDAVQKLGDWSARTLHHNAALWLAGQVSGPVPRRLKDAIFSAHTSKNKHPLTIEQLKPIAAEFLGTKPRTKKACARCDRLAAALLEAGIEVPE